MPGYVHHIQWCVSPSAWEDCVTKLKQFGFSPVAQRRGEILLSVGETLFLVTQHQSGTPEVDHDGYPRFCCGQEGTTGHVERVFNVCLEVERVEETFRRMVDRGSRGLVPPTTVFSTQGEVVVALITSPCDNVVHALLDTRQFSGTFLPGFEPIAGDEVVSLTHMDHKEEDGGVSLSHIDHKVISLTHMDHITFVCRAGESRGILQWYKDTCGMNDFPVRKNREEEKLILGEEYSDEGYVEGDVKEEGALYLGGHVGLRLQAGEWMSQWLCREQGVQMEEVQEEGDGGKRNFKLVLAEPLEGHPDSHVQKFLDFHHGPGVQHIGLLTQDIQSTVSSLVEGGVSFRNPPPTYYCLEKKMGEFASSGLVLATCQRLGILVDREVGGDVENSNVLQIFSQPIFQEQDTFFLEVIQRNGAARGFGSGNISALALSIIEYNKQKDLEPS